MIPSWDQTGVPIHFHSSTTSGSACLMSWRILLRVSPRQSPSSAILFEISSDAGWPWLAPDFFMFSSWKFQIYFHLQDSEPGHAGRLEFRPFPSASAPGSKDSEFPRHLFVCDFQTFELYGLDTR